MEIDQTQVYKEEIDYWCKEYPELTRDEISDIIEVIDISGEKDKFWKNNPDLPEETVDKVVSKAAISSYDYHQYRDLNNEAP